MQEAHLIANDLYLCVRQARHRAIGRVIGKMLRHVTLGVLQWLIGWISAVRILRALEREHQGLLNLDERGRKDIGMSLYDVETGARKIRQRQIKIIRQACLGKTLDDTRFHR
jgi:hypothetical protein